MSRLGALRPLLALGLALLCASSSAGVAAAMPDQVVRSPGPVGRGGVVVAPALMAVPPGRDAVPSRGVWPLDPEPEVVREFDPPRAAYSAGHRGVDLRGRVGQPVRAALAGEVTYAGRLAGRGVVVVSHGPTRTTYEPVTAAVRRGDRVGRGEVIGALQWSGSHCLPLACLHWGLRRGETYLDPLELVGGGPQPVRLYPW
jgi:murein DD-endopeptidase MepM/ murein hydrolase activator NlpD